MVCTNLRKYNLQNLKAIQWPRRGVRESAGQAAAAASPDPLIPIHTIALERCGDTERKTNGGAVK